MYPRIVFYGTPQFAAASLDAILKEGFEVAAVVTAPDKPAGRGLKIMQPYVKTFANEKNLRVLQPESLKDPSFLDELREISPDLQVIVAFRKLPAAVFGLPPLGTFNLHASLLPKYRGAAPINHAIINGETETGVTTFFLREEIDTGNMLFSEKVSIRPDEIAGELHDKLMMIGSELVVKTIHAIIEKTVVPVPQPPVTDPADPAFKAPKIHKEDCRIDVAKSTRQVFNLIRGLSPHPAAFTDLKLVDGNDLHIKIFECTPEYGIHQYKPGTFISDGKHDLKLALSDGMIHITKIQPAGRRIMGIAQFLRGFGARID